MVNNWMKSSKADIFEEILLSLEDSTWTPELHHSPSSCDLKLISGGWKWAWRWDWGQWPDSNYDIRGKNYHLMKTSQWAHCHCHFQRSIPTCVSSRCSSGLGVSAVCVSVCDGTHMFWHVFACLLMELSIFFPSWSDTENNSDSGRDRWALLPVAEADGYSDCEERSSQIRKCLQRRNFQGPAWKRISVTKNLPAQFDL